MGAPSRRTFAPAIAVLLLGEHAGRRGHHQLDPDERYVAEALVRTGEVATIALEECGRRATGTVGPDRRPVLAGIEQAPAPPSAEEQGSRPAHSPAAELGEAAGLASGESQGGAPR
jgi:hypothetical protein